eukprot:scaffold268_cov236-Pinguiococcus_pyrenoidosus.AAC.5
MGLRDLAAPWRGEVHFVVALHHFAHGLAHSLEVVLRVQEVRAVLDERDGHVRRRRQVCDAEDGLGWHLRVRHSVDQADGTVHDELLGATQQEVVAAVLDETPADGVLRVSPRDLVDAVVHDLLLGLFAELLPQQVFREVGIGGEAHQARHKVRSPLRHQQHDPASHPGAHEHDLSAGRQVLNHADGVLRPAADGAVHKVSRRARHAEVVRANERVAVLAAPALQVGGLGAVLGLVQTRQVQDAGRLLTHPHVEADFVPVRGGHLEVPPALNLHGGPAPHGRARPTRSQRFHGHKQRKQPNGIHSGATQPLCQAFN